MTEQEVKVQSMTYSKKVEKALATCKTLAEVEEVIKAVETTSQINRRTKAGRQETLETLALCYTKAQDIINLGELPFN